MRRRVWAVWLALFTVSTGIALPASAHEPGDLTAFRWIDGEGRGTFRIHPDGTTSPERLNDLAPGLYNAEVHTALSPGGGRVALEAGGSRRSNIFVTDLDDEKTIQLTKGNNKKESPSWSPDGERIVADCGGQLCVVRANGKGEPRTLTDNRYSENEPQWSPNGKRIAFSSARGILTIRPDGTGLRRLTKSSWDGTPMWSPDSRHLVFNTYAGTEFSNLYRIDADGSNRKKLTGSDAYDTEQEWAPDGSRILFVRDKPLDDGETSCVYIMTMKPNGDDPEKITDCFKGSGFAWLWPSWSPDSAHIAFIIRLITTGEQSASNVVVMDRDGSNWRNVTKTTGRYVTWFGLDW
jgi:Tol biopolymer transport system component